MSFIATAQQAATDEPETVTADGWWPDMDIAAFRDEIRLPDMVTTARIVAALRDGMIHVAAELAVWRTEREEEGHMSLSAIPASQFGGISSLVSLYGRAVTHLAAADLAERHRDMSATNDGDDRSDEYLKLAADYRRESVWAIRGILGESRNRIEMV